MPDESKARAACELLFEHWHEGRRLACLPAHLAPGSREEGYAVQRHLEAHSHEPLFGWKIAATSAAGQAHIGVDGPLAGRILAERVVPNGGCVTLGSNHMRVAEVEFAFRMGTSLPPRTAPYRMDEVLDAIATLHPAIEIPDSRFDDFGSIGAPQLIADNACAHLFVLGPATQAPWRGADLAAHAAIGRVLGRYERRGSGANVLGDPRTALAWLANELSRLGIVLEAGQVVTTGTCVIPLDVKPGDRVEADLGIFGEASVQFA